MKNNNEFKMPSATDQVANSPFINALLGFGDSYSNLMRGSLDLLPGVNIPTSKTGSGKAYDYGGYAGDVASFVTGGAELDALRAAAAAKKLGYLSKGAKALEGGGASGVARRALGSGLYAAAKNPSSQPQSAVVGGLTSAALDAAFGGLSKLVPSSIFKGNISPEELKANLSAAQGTNTPLGDVLGSPTLKKIYDNVISNIPLSGTDQKLASVGLNLKQKGEDISNKYLGDTDESEIKNKILNSLQTAAKDTRTEKNNLFNNFYDYAESKGYNNLQVPSFKKSAGKYSFPVSGSNSPEDSLTQDLLKYSPDKVSTFKKLISSGEKDKNYSPSLMESLAGQYNTPTNPSVNLKDAGIFASHLGGLSNKLMKAIDMPSRMSSGIYGELGSSLKQDIGDYIDSTGDSKLRDLYDTAHKNYKEKSVPFLDKDIYSFTQGDNKYNTDDLINSFITVSKSNDKPIQAQKIMSKLDPESKDLVRYSILSRAKEGGQEDGLNSINPMKLSKLWGNIGPETKKVLFENKDSRKELDDFSRLVGMNSEALNRLYNPKTGNRALSLMLTGFALSKVPSLGASVGAANLSNKYLTSENVRNSMAKAILGGKSNTESAIKNTGRVINPLLQPMISEE